MTEAKDRRKVSDKKLNLRKEDLDIATRKAKAGDVEIGKDIFEEEQSVDVPVEHEEVVIERHDLNNVISDEPIEEKTMHIPVSEEHVDVDKHTELTGQVEAHKSEETDTKHVKERLKKEKARIETEGDPNIVDKDFNGHH